jgi:hypothetical protein
LGIGISDLNGSIRRAFEGPLISDSPNSLLTYSRHRQVLGIWDLEDGKGEAFEDPPNAVFTRGPAP